MADRLLDVRDLSVRFETDDGTTQAVDELSFTLGRARGARHRRRVGVRQVGDDALAAAAPAADGASSPAARASATPTCWPPSNAQLKRIRGREIAFVFQEPMTSLNPSFTVGRQVGEVLQRHLGYSRRAARARAVELLDLVRIPAPASRVDEYPHQLSGGMRQRVMIAIALACDPKILIADEPTTALDVTIQAGILDLMRDIRDRLGTAIVLITHNLGVVADIADRVIVMYAGRKAEEAPVHELYEHPQHPYTIGLLGAIPRRGVDRLQEIPGLVPRLAEPLPYCAFAERCPRADRRSRSEVPQLREVRPSHLVGVLPSRERMTTAATPVLEVEGLVKHFHVGPQLMGGGGIVQAVDGVSLTIGPGELVGLVGESGSGKSTVGNCIARLVEPTAGTIRILGTDVTHLSRREMRPLRREVHMVFQDPYSSLNPRMTTGAIVGEPLRLHGIARRRSLDKRVVSLFEHVGLRPELRHRYPHELSGGQRQRVGLARALSVSLRC